MCPMPCCFTCIPGMNSCVHCSSLQAVFRRLVAQRCCTGTPTTSICVHSSALGTVSAPSLSSVCPTAAEQLPQQRTPACMAGPFVMYPNNEHLYRMYARFLEHVKSDPWSAQKFTETAEKLEEEQDQTGANLIAQDDAASLLENVNEKIHAVLVINAEGIMLVANKQLQKLFGYKKTEIEGKNINMMMPQPFSQRHNGYLRNYVSTGKKRIIDSIREVVALHKNKNVFPIQLAVTKVSGVGNDSVFMGVLRPYTVEAGVIRVWCTPSGGVISVDERFFDSFGKTYSEVAGRPFSSLVRDQDVIMKLLERAQAASVEDFIQGKIREPEMYMLHAYLDPIKVELQVELGGTDTQRLLAFNIRLLETQGMLQVVNNDGRVLYMNEDMRKFLGVKDIAGIKHANLANQMPLPFNFLHNRWMKEPNAKVPKQSCRASATVVMLNSQGKSTPVKPKITSREVCVWSVCVCVCYVKCF
ncbi:hypothetical protein DUNSADRAFT_16104 [Dunaliella salina]|uniref:PAS domain-containing protein n=1 Tax=Dunaliella salina TaxID=3046 RepID=A0ABQ7G487_DUNSA|nr:hypothetical protein DUNSADRAFT_16104 [Dunaliella salina]|eukprot:KAF5829405.1 hypothetical protein DUNSADRAFT_16104 [Dunaliella salina]